VNGPNLHPSRLEAPEKTAWSSRSSWQKLPLYPR
jgi:hypothetical protein